MLYALALLTTMVIGYQPSCVGNCCQCNDALVPSVLPEYSDRILALSNYDQVTTDSLIRCGVRCMRQKKCKSLNYDAASRTCTLSVESHLSTPDKMFVRPTQHWVYYAVGQWGQSVLGGCANHGCATEEVCVEYGGNVEAKYTCRPSYGPDLGCLQSSCAGCQPVRAYVDRTFTAKGCYPNHQTNALPTFLGNFRSNTIVWDDLSSFEEVLEKCASLAGNYDMFGIEYYGECYAGNNADVTFPGEVDVTECMSKCLYGDVGVGHNDVLFVYQWN